MARLPAPTVDRESVTYNRSTVKRCFSRSSGQYDSDRVQLPETLISDGISNVSMSSMEAREEKTEAEAQENIDRAVEEALDLDFTSFREVKEAFQS